MKEAANALLVIVAFLFGTAFMVVVGQCTAKTEVYKETVLVDSVFVTVTDTIHDTILLKMIDTVYIRKVPFCKTKISQYEIENFE